mgnify:CR=1 FL=1
MRLVAAVKVKSDHQLAVIEEVLNSIKARAFDEWLGGNRVNSSITETSIANLAMVQNGQIISPPADTILSGITQTVVEALAAELGIDWRQQAINGDELRQADEIVLMGTDGGIWFASSVDGVGIGGGMPGEIYRILRKAFDQATVGKRSNS